MNSHSKTIVDPDSPLQVAVAVFLVATLAYFTARLADILVLRPQMIWPVWPGCAFVVAVLLLTARKIWPALLIGGLAGFAFYDIQTGLTIRSTVWYLLADSVEILVAALGLNYAFGGVPYLNSIKSLAKYSLFAAVLAPISVASLSASTLGGNYRIVWKIGFLTEALALLILTPAILSWVNIALRRVNMPWAHCLEAALMFVGLAALGYFAFVMSSGRFRPVLLYSLIPLLLWSALRFGISGITNAVTVVVCLSVWGTIHGRGPFTGSTAVDNVLSLQLFSLFAAISFMILAVLVEERKSDERKLRESEQRFRLVANAAPSLIWMSGTDKLCTYFNQSWLDFTGRSMEQELGKGWAEGVHLDDLQRCLDTYQQSFDRREKFRMEYRLRHHDGEYHWIFDVGVPRFNQDRSFAGYIGVGVDISERKMAEEALSDMTRKLIEAQEQERARIARELHDDINQRLAMLAVELEHVQQNRADLPQDILNHMHELRQETIQISADVQALSHDLHSSKLEYLGAVAGIRSWCKEFGERQEMQIDWGHDVRSTLPAEIGLCLFRVLQEALHNAAKHSGVKRIAVQLHEESGEIHLIIRDFGKGLDIEAATRGHGLGLTSMRERVRLVKGTITIDSKPMGGTTIDVRVPIESKKVLNVAG